MEVRLEEARAEHACLQTSNADFDQRCGFMWRRGSCVRSSSSGARGAAQRGSVVHRARQGACGGEITACRDADPLRWT